MHGPHLPNSNSAVRNHSGTKSIHWFYVLLTYAWKNAKIIERDLDTKTKDNTHHKKSYLIAMPFLYANVHAHSVTPAIHCHLHQW